jgi:hypothetical protein
VVPITRLFTDDDGHARFDDIELPLQRVTVIGSLARITGHGSTGG